MKSWQQRTATTPRQGGGRPCLRSVRIYVAELPGLQALNLRAAFQP